jgi:hypothetical protein
MGFTAACTVTSGTVLTPTQGGTAYAIVNGTGNSSGGATGFINCPEVNVGFGVITSYEVLASISYENGPIQTFSGTQVDQTLTIVGGVLNGSSSSQSAFGGFSPFGTSYSPELNFQIGSAPFIGVNSYGAFTINVNSFVAAGGPVGNATGSVFISYEAIPVPEPSTHALIGLGIVAGELARRMIRR